MELPDLHPSHLPPASPGLPPGFVFSQSSLQDFQDCPRRFELRYLLRVAWPAVQSEPLQAQEHDLRLGQRFHRLAQQRLLGVPSDRLTAFLDEPDLADWWRQFEQFLEQNGLAPVPGGAGRRLHPEASLTAPLAGQRVVAQYDLIVAGQDGRLTIYDWKTNRKRPRREWLAKRSQTQVYRYLLACAGQSLLDGCSGPVAPEAVEMIYWFAAYPDQPERFTYQMAQFEQDRADLTRQIEHILRRAALQTALPTDALQAERFPLTSVTRQCDYCVYRSLCGRGERAADLSAAEDDLALDLNEPGGFNFEQIAEISF